MNEEKSLECIVLDLGSGYSKAGIAGNDQPVIIPTVVGRGYSGASNGKEKLYFGNDAFGRVDVELIRPVVNGIVRDWILLEKLLGYIFSHELRLDVSQHAVLVADAILAPKADRETMTKVLFEKFNVRGVFIQWAPVLGLYASGRTTGLVVDVGYDCMQVVPIYEGYAVKKASSRQELGGRKITEQLLLDLQSDGISLDYSAASLEVIQSVKEHLCYCAEDYNAEIERPIDDISREYTLPDRSVISIGRPRFTATENIFKPKSLSKEGGEYTGLSEAVEFAISISEIDLRNALASNIVLNGGTTLTENLPRRLDSDLSRALTTVPTVYAPPERQYAVWIGGSILGSLPSFASSMLSKAQYDENGNIAIHSTFL